MTQSVIKKNTYFVFVGQAIQMALAFLLMLFAARYLGDSEFGKYALASTIMYFILLANDLGINIYITREMAKFTHDAESYFSKALGVKLILIPANVLLLIVFLILSPYQNDTKIAILIFGLYGLLQSNVQLITSVFRALQVMKYDTIVIVLEKIMTTGLGIFVLLKGWGLLPFCGVFVVGGLISIVFSARILKKEFFNPKFKIDFKYGKKLIIIAIPFGIALILSNVYNNLGILILSWMETSQIVGWYSSAFKLVNFTNVIPTVLAIALFPAISIEVTRSKEKFQELYSRGFKYLFYAALPMVAGTVVLSDKIILLVFGQEFANASIALKILIWSGGLIFFNTYFAWFFNATNNQKKLVSILVVALFLNIVFNYYFILKYSYVGAAIATTFTELAIFIICFTYTWRKISALQEISFIFKSIFSTTIMTIFLLLTPGIHVLLAISFAGLIYLISLYLIKGFTLEEILLIPAHNKNVEL